MTEERPHTNWLSLAARVWCLVGVLAFGGVFFSTFVARPQLEAAAHEFLVEEVTERVRSKLGSSTASLQAKSSAMQALLKKSAKKSRAFLDSELPELIGRTLAAHCGCAEGQVARADSIARSFREGAARRIAEVEEAIGGLKELALGVYQERLEALIVEIRIFSGINTALYGSLRLLRDAALATGGR